MNYRQQFFTHIAQTSNAPMALEIVTAKGIYLYDALDKEYIDMISGFSVANIGHSHPKVIDAIKDQAEQYMHTIVYGEYIQTPQVTYAKLLTDHLPTSLNCVYFTNSGAEATEGALKLAKRVTNRTKIIAFNNAYHGSTHGALSVMGDEYFRNAYRPLLPNIFHFNYNEDEVLKHIDSSVACVIVETIQAESGITKPSPQWLQAIRKKCDEHCVLLILDEIQAGFGRSGSLWAFEQMDIIPDILLLGKALGGGMPLGAFIAENRLMSTLTNNPVLGHITTFGGHPVSCAAGKAAMEILLENNFIKDVFIKQQYLKDTFNHHPKIKKINYAGLWMAIEFYDSDTNLAIIKKCIENGLITDYFLFNNTSLRVAPPLSITIDELEKMCTLLLESIKSVLCYS